MLDQPLEPRQLVSELRTRLGIAVRQIQRSNDDATDLRLDIAAVRVVRIAG